MSNNFVRGQKIVCIVDDWHTIFHKYHPTLPKKGLIYTIRDMYADAAGNPGLLLVEIVSKANNTSHVEQGFATTHFRPALDHKTDISIFTEMLTPKTVSVD